MAIDIDRLDVLKIALTMFSVRIPTNLTYAVALQ